MFNSKTMSREEFQEIFERFKTRSFGFEHHLEEAPRYRDVREILIKVSLAFEAHKRARYSLEGEPPDEATIKRLIAEAEKDHLASILRACGLLDEDCWGRED